MPRNSSTPLFFSQKGLLSDDELPVHYRRSLIQEESEETYNEVLVDTLGFDNPSSVDLLSKELKISEDVPPTSMRALQRFVLFFLCKTWHIIEDVSVPSQGVTVVIIL